MEQAQELLLRLPQLSAHELAGKLISIGLYTDDALKNEWKTGRGHYPDDPVITFDEFIDSNRSFYVEMLGFLQSGRAASCDDAWQIHKQDLETFGEQMQESIRAQRVVSQDKLKHRFRKQA